MFIGIISDTHGVFSDEFKAFLSPVDEIWHAGDFGGSINFSRSREFTEIVTGRTSGSFILNINVLNVRGQGF